MTFDAVTYLFQIYWPFLLIAFAIGIATGWYSGTPEADKGDHA